jgi:predicted amidohydrolase
VAVAGWGLEDDHASLEDFDWSLLRTETESILGLARTLEPWVVLGSAHRLSDTNKPHNCPYVISPEGKRGFHE